MKNGIKLVLCLLWVLCPLPLGAQDDAVSNGAKPSIDIQRVGQEPVGGGQRVTLEGSVADIFGSCWNFNDKSRVVALIEMPGGKWRVAGVGTPEAGGVYNLLKVHFPPGKQTFELIVALVETDQTPDSLLTEQEWQTQAKAVSRVTVTIE